MSGKEAVRARRRAGVWKKRLGWLGGAAMVLAACVVVRQYWGPAGASAQVPARSPRSGAAPAQQSQQPSVQHLMAMVNGKEIRRSQLATACVHRFGEEVLESLVNKHLIAIHCRQQNVQITQRDVDEEIERMATKFRLGKEQWLEMLQKERGINPTQYARDIIWPTLALRRLAADKLHVTEKELHEAYESQYGPAVQTRLIATADLNLARRLRTQLQAQPDEFARLARDHSQDINSASAGGLLQPIHRHVGSPQIEQVVFTLAEGEISPVIRVGEQYAIFRCEKHIPARKVPMEEVREQLAERIREGKLREAANDLFARMQAGAVVVNVFNDPVKARQLPGVAATINGNRITMNELAEECLARYGHEVLDGEINRVLLQQELTRCNLKLTRQDLDREVAHAAVLNGVITPQGEADLARWKKIVTQQQQVSYETYLRDAVWPSAALKKLVDASISVTEEDLQKSYEANYGPRVRCRAIVMSNLRRAQEVWDKARRTPTVENFGTLAEQYSVEASSRSLKGEVPPIRRHAGQPLLEKAAYSLRPGEISEIVQVNDKFVILYCEGFTQTKNIAMEEVRELIQRDVFEKKLRLAMAERFEQVRDNAQIDDYLAGTSQSPAKAKTAGAHAAAPRR